MFCIECGQQISNNFGEQNYGESICKGCSKLSPGIQEELLSLNEKMNKEEIDIKCKDCGADIKGEHNYCSKCGSKILH